MSRAPSGQLGVFRGIRESLGTPSSFDQAADANLVIRIKPTQQLFPSDVVKSRMRESNATTELNLSQHASVKAGSETDDYEKSSIGTSDDNFDPSRDPDPREITAAAVQHWEANKENYPVFDMQQSRGDPGTDDCDINTVTGKLIPPVRYIKLQRDSKEQAHIRRRMDLTSGGHIARELARRQTLKEEIQRREQEAQYINQAIIQEETWPNAGCTLRPVATKDFQVIAEIINLEMKQGQDSQIFISSNKVDPAHIATLYNACLAKHRPFVVAVPSPGQIPNRAGWSKAEEDEYQEFLKFKEARNASQSPNILGFAFIADSRQGFLGGACPGSRFTGQIKLVVHPSHRRKLIGTALLDRILMCASIYHRSLIDYTWDCSEARRTYEYVSAHNQQKYNKLYLETFLIGGEDPRMAGISRLLEKFDFERVAHFKDAVKHGNQPGIWKDLIVWELETRLTSEIVED
ncbi:acyl n-acyltransferase [Fusarium heterosporum]|uniref:Acyl n-acyltransferase n=1 Tax=Fusarium heterosporum TaxID=42747 RepID=A0A8H5SVA8_FUSHE|nr:acyl n-acyltransferase [Fusarium heterosporum]